jgi:hypothetical protein
MPEIPLWLHTLAIVSLAGGGGCALIILIDILAGQRQKMWIMNVVWPITGLYAGPLALWGYFGIGRLSTVVAERRPGNPKQQEKSFWQATALAATHCGSGCTLGDIVAEWIIFLTPLTLFGRQIFAGWALDFLLAYLFGIAFQYFTIRPMGGRGVKESLLAAVKADTLSLTSWQVGMYGWMAIVTFGLFGRELSKTDPVFWFMMQIAMLCGFLTAYPVNWWLLRRGIKERM